MSMRSIINVVEVVEAVKRVPPDSKQSFFGMYDIWRYHAKFDIKLCDDCLMHADTHYFVGKYLRGLFQYLEIQDQDTIDVKVHPNCRCTLHRVTDPAEYIMASASLFD